MPKRPEFKPDIKKVKLNPEQTVLVCNCWYGGQTIVNTGVGETEHAERTFSQVFSTTGFCGSGTKGPLTYTRTLSPMTSYSYLTASSS